MLKRSSRLPSALQSGLLAACCAGLLAACGGGGGDSGGGGGNGAPAGGPVTISGKASYEFPPPGFNCQGLDFNAVQLRPVRQATIQALDAGSDAVLDADVTDDAGNFALTVDPGTQVYLRVRAELKSSDGPTWDVEVRDNTIAQSATGQDLLLNQRPLYVLESSDFDSGGVDFTRDITAATGWNDSTQQYTGARSAAPFAVLDTAYAGMLLVLAEEPLAVFEPLDIFWSINNRPTDGEIEDGHIGTSFYRSDNNLFLLGSASSDADEFDDHVVAHEWGHYFEDAFSRSDSIGGAHGLGDKLDMRVAFGEGFATALSGMALANPLYCDTTLTNGFRINIESHGESVPGWFSEVSVMKFVYDLWDTVVDGRDTGSIGFGPIYRVMMGAQAATPTFTSIFSFATALKSENPPDVEFINALLDENGIRADGVTAFGDDETNDGDASDDLTDLGPDGDVLPVYTSVTPDATTVSVCSNSQYDRNSGVLLATGNKLSEHRFLRMTIDTPDRYRFEIRMTNTEDLPPDDPNNDREQSDPDKSDPDILILLDGVLQNRTVNGDLQGFSGDANEEIFTTPDEMVPGEYVMALVEFRYQDEATSPDYPARSCFDVTVTPAP